MKKRCSPLRPAVVMVTTTTCEVLSARSTQTVGTKGSRAHLELTPPTEREAALVGDEPELLRGEGFHKLGRGRHHPQHQRHLKDSGRRGRGRS